MKLLIVASTNQAIIALKMKHSMKTRQALGKPQRKDFGFRDFFNSPAPKMFGNGTHQLEKRSGKCVYNSSNRIPAIRTQTGYRPQNR